MQDHAAVVVRGFLIITAEIIRSSNTAGSQGGILEKGKN